MDRRGSSEWSSGATRREEEGGGQRAEGGGQNSYEGGHCLGDSSSALRPLPSALRSQGGRLKRDDLDTLIGTLGTVDHRSVDWRKVRWTAYLIHQHLRYDYPG